MMIVQGISTDKKATKKRWEKPLKEL